MVGDWTGGAVMAGIHCATFYPPQTAPPAPTYVPVTASGGTITSYTSGGITYRVHTFLTSGYFSVSSLGVNAHTTYEVIAIAAGGAGGNGPGDVGGGGGGGGGGFGGGGGYSGGGGGFGGGGASGSW